MAKSIRISEAEWEVMSVVWKESPIAVSDVYERLKKKRAWSHATVRTLLRRLAAKGALSQKAEGKRYLYSPKVDREECERRESRSLLDRVFGGESAALVLRLARDARFTRAEIQELRKILKEKEKK